MPLSNITASVLLLDINLCIEEYADAAVQNIIEARNFDSLVYPPNGGLTEGEKKELEELDNNDNLKNALRKVIADSTAGVLFELFNVIDGTGGPQLRQDEWKGVQLVDDQEDASEDPFPDMLHDGLFEAYWEWRQLRGDKSWKLDNWEG